MTDSQTGSHLRANTFEQLGLGPGFLKVLKTLGYESPSPIQAQAIPLLLQGRDLVGQAQTGSGKTAAFALPMLDRLDIKLRDPQVLVLTPTRELAIQVSEAFHRYAHGLRGFHGLPVYGGQDYGVQIRALQRGVHVIVGTPGRLADHIRRGTLVLDTLTSVVLDEADEMLRMGFIEDVQWILEQAPKKRQLALFSATMPEQIRRIAATYLNEPAQVTINTSNTTAETIRQRYWPVQGFHKLDALTRILEAEPFDAMLVFVRTRLATVDLAEKLTARGFACAALNGDMPQRQRERTIEQLKRSELDILVATDVAARGLDVSRVSHVVNYDIPTDTEAYIHRIGRTGRAGREGNAILFVTPREKRLLFAIEHATTTKIEALELPSTDEVNNRRIEKFKQQITETLDSVDLDLFMRLIREYQRENDVPALNIAAALAQLSQGDAPFLLQNKPHHVSRQGWANETRRQRTESDSHGGKGVKRGKARQAADRPPAEDMERFRLAVGHEHGVMPGNIVGAIANEANINSRYIGRISIHDQYSYIDLPAGMPDEVYHSLKKTWVAGRKLDITRLEDTAGGKRTARSRAAQSKAAAKRGAKSKRKPARRKR
jgi:ATP-dependent RNA helicase DeaD